MITYRKFYWFWIWVFALIASYLTLGVFSESFNPIFSIFYACNDVMVYGIIALMLSYIPAYIVCRYTNHMKVEKIWRYVSIAVIAIVLVDRVLLQFISTVLDTIALTKNPKGFLETIIYMAYNSRTIWLNGIIGTLKISAFGTVFGFILAVLLLFLRVQTPDKRDPEWKQLVKMIGNGFAKTYVTIIRGTPMMVQALIIYYGGFALVQFMMPNATISEVTGVWSYFTAALICVSLNTTAYLSEVLRGGIESLDPGQSEAAASLGFTPWQTLMKVVFPQAVRNSIPAICNEFIINVKDTAVLNVIGVTELMFCTSTVTGMYYKYLEVYCITAVIYLIMTFTLTKLMNAIARKMDMPTSRGVPSSN